MKKFLTCFMAVVFILSSGEIYARGNGNGNGGGGGGNSGREDNRGGGNRGGNSDGGGNREGSGRSDKGRDNKGNSGQKKGDREAGKGNSSNKVNNRDKPRKKEAVSGKQSRDAKPRKGAEAPKPGNPIGRPKPENPIERPKPSHPVERPKPSHPIERPKPEHPMEKPSEMKDAHKNWGKLKGEESFDSKNEEKARKEEIKAERTVRRNFRMSGLDGDVDQAVNDYVNGRLTSDELRRMGVSERGVWHSERAVDKYEKSLNRIGHERPDTPESEAPKPEQPIERPKPTHPIERPKPENPMESHKPTNPIS